MFILKYKHKVKKFNTFIFTISIDVCNVVCTRRKMLLYPYSFIDWSNDIADTIPSINIICKEKKIYCDKINCFVTFIGR